MISVGVHFKDTGELILEYIFSGVRRTSARVADAVAEFKIGRKTVF